MKTYDDVVDALFLVDILVIFNTAYYSPYLELITSRKQIAKKYVTGWFLIDVMSILPIELLADSINTNFNSIIRFARMGKLARLIRLTKLLRLLKIFRDKAKIIKMLSDFLKLRMGMERLLFFSFLTIIMAHIVSCLWVLIPQIDSTNTDEEGAKDYEGTWIEPYYLEYEGSESEIYIISFYWTIQTIVTVGYGDIGAKLGLERVFQIITMIIGVIFFSFVNGTFTSIISNYDIKDANYK